MVKNRSEISLEREENYFGDSSSVCSEEGSNYPEEQEPLSHFRTTLESRRRHASKKYQVARLPKLSKKKDKIKVAKKMRILQQLIPYSSNSGNACVLDEAIEYIKILQNQLQFISSANAFTAGMYTSMMQTLQQPTMMNQFYASYENGVFSSVPNLVGSRSHMPHAGMIFQQPSISSVPFSPHGSLMPFRSK